MELASLLQSTYVDPDDIFEKSMLWLNMYNIQIFTIPLVYNAGNANHMQSPNHNIISSSGIIICEMVHPPIRIMGLFCMFSSSPMPACFSFLRFTAPPMMSRRRCSRGPHPSGVASEIYPFPRAVSSCFKLSKASSSIGRPWFPSRSMSLRETSVLPCKQTFRLPSLVIRNRLHDPQKSFVILVMKPILPVNPGI